MKKILITIAMFFSIASYSQITDATLTASGLTCSMCSKSIYMALQKVSFVEKVNTNIAETNYSIIFKKNAAVNFDALRKAVEGAGFTVSKLVVTVPFNNVPIQNDAMINIAGEYFHFLNVQPQTLNGEKTLTIIDAHFTTDKERAKYAQYTTMKCFKTGIAADCCDKNIAARQRIYHVTI
jgi:copper chaperone CopZ